MTDQTERRTSPLGLRFFPSVKAALEAAATAERRSIASLVELIVVDWLKEKGYLPK